MNLLICLEACKAELKRRSVVGMLKTTQWGKGLFCSTLGTFSHTICSTPHWVLCIICSSPFISFMEMFHNVCVATAAPKGLGLTGGHWQSSMSQPGQLWGLDQARSAQGCLGTSPVLPSPASSTSRVYSLGNHRLTSWEPLGWAHVTMNFGLNDPWKQPGQTCSTMPSLRTGCLKKHHVGNKMKCSYGCTSSASGSKFFSFQSEAMKQRLRFRFES